MEKTALGAGQTVWSQGILHGGAKYTLRGLTDKLAGITPVIARMPEIWRDALAGDAEPDLSAARIRAPHCYLWRSDSLKSKVSLIGASVALRTRPESIPKEQRPPLLRDCPGEVYRIAEEVIAPATVLETFAGRNRQCLLKFDQLTVHSAAPHPEFTVREGDEECRVSASKVILAAGGGNAGLREAFGLDARAMQLRPLKMIMARGSELPELNGHCIDGAKTRVTVTTDQDAEGRRIWQIGGQVAEDGTKMSDADLIKHTTKELKFAIPGVDLDGSEWTTYDAPRAEAAAGKGLRPDDVAVLTDRAVTTVWPTKMVLAPRVAERLLESLGDGPGGNQPAIDWPRPSVALPPWEEPRQWIK